MSVTESTAIETPAASTEGGHVEGSQLSLYRRIRVLIFDPSDAFSLFSERERIGTAWIVFWLYCAVRIPVVLQKSVATGRFDGVETATATFLFVVGVAGGIVMNALFLVVGGLLIHLVFNLLMKRGRRYVDALSVAALAGAPQLLLIVEVPTLLLGLNDTGVFQAFVWIRGVLVILTLRVFYWGLRRVFDAGRLAAWCFVLLPLGLGVAWGVAAIVLGG